MQNINVPSTDVIALCDGSQAGASQYDELVRVHFEVSTQTSRWNSEIREILRHLVELFPVELMSLNVGAIYIKTMDSKKKS